MIRATIHRNENANQWVVLIRDTIRETRKQIPADTLAEAEQIAKQNGADSAKVMIGG